MASLRTLLQTTQAQARLLGSKSSRPSPMSHVCKCLSQNESRINSLPIILSSAKLHSCQFFGIDDSRNGISYIRGINFWALKNTILRNKVTCNNDSKFKLQVTSENNEEKLTTPISTQTVDKNRDSDDWYALCGWLFLLGLGFGPPLDGLHSVVGLQVYDNGFILIGEEPYGLHTDIWVFPLLGVMYSAVGAIQLILDRKFLSSNVHSKTSWDQVLASICILIGLLRLSAQLYDDEMNSVAIFAILLLCAHGNWYVFDKTIGGYFLALLLAIAAPLSEVFIMRYFELWHYSEPDIFIAGQGLVSWTSCCYFFYTQFVATLARCLSTYFLSPREEDTTTNT